MNEPTRATRNRRRSNIQTPKEPVAYSPTAAQEARHGLKAILALPAFRLGSPARFHVEQALRFLTIETGSEGIDPSTFAGTESLNRVYLSRSAVSPALDHNLLHRCQAVSDGSNIHRLNNLRAAYLACWELGSRRWTPERVISFCEAERILRVVVIKAEGLRVIPKAA